MSLSSDEITPGELRRWLTRIDETLKALVSMDKHEALERRVTGLEDGRASLIRILLTAVVGVVGSAVVIVLKTKGGAP